MTKANLFLALVTILVLGLVGGFWISSRVIVKKPVEEIKLPTATVAAPTQQPIGEDTDEHGCYLTAGYSWCNKKQKCLRSWKEPCEEEKEATEAAELETKSDAD